MNKIIIESAKHSLKVEITRPSRTKAFIFIESETLTPEMMLELIRKVYNTIENFKLN